MELTTDRGEIFTTYLVGESHQEKGILLLHDGWGLLDYNRTWADRFAQAGYQAMAIDLYDGYHPSAHREVSTTTKNLDQAVANRKIHTALLHLKANVSHIAVLGWSFGGVQAQQTAFNLPTLVDVLILYYCRLLINKTRAQQLNCPILAVFAENERMWPDKQADLEQIMYELDKPLTCHSYEADTGFLNPTHEAYDTELCEQVWRDTLSFLTAYLK